MGLLWLKQDLSEKHVFSNPSETDLVLTHAATNDQPFLAQRTPDFKS
jgi:hypothetical protein